MSLEEISDSETVEKGWFNEARKRAHWQTDEVAVVTHEQYGAVADGHTSNPTDNHQAFKDALNSGATWVYVPAGTYFVNQELSVPDGTKLVGDGPQTTVITFDGATGTFQDGCLSVRGSGLSKVSELSSAVSVSDENINLSSTSNLSQGDIIAILDTRDGSYTGYRTQYKKGEFHEVHGVSDSTVELQDAILERDGYPVNTNVAVYQLQNPPSVHIEGLHIEGRGGINNNTTHTVDIRDAAHITIQDCLVTNSRDKSLDLARVYDATISDTTCRKLILDNGLGTSYALSLRSSQNIRIEGCNFVGDRRGLNTGAGGALTTHLVVRNILVSNTRIRNNRNGRSSVGIHGAAELVNVDGCRCDGMTLGGDRIKVSDCHIDGQPRGSCVRVREASGPNYQIHDCELFSNTDPPTNRARFVDMGGNAGDLDSNAKFGGTFSIKDCQMETPVSDDGFSGVKVFNRGHSGVRLRVEVRDCTITCERSSNGGAYGVSVDSRDGGDPWDEVVVSDCVVENRGISVQQSLNLECHDNLVYGGANHGIHYNIKKDSGVNADFGIIAGNKVKDHQEGGIIAGGDINGSDITRVLVDDNLSVGNSIAGGNSSVLNSAMGYADVADLHLRDNVAGGSEANQDRQLGLSRITNLYEGGNHWFGSGGRDYSDPSLVQGATFYGSVTWDPASLADGAGATSPDIGVTHARPGDAVDVAPPVDLQGVTATGWVKSNGTVKIRLQNETGVAVDLGSGAWRVKVQRVES